MQRWILIATALMATLWADASAAQKPEWIGQKREEMRARRMRGDGSWRVVGEGQRVVQRWSLDIDRNADGDITGSVVVDDSPVLDNGRVRGKINGRQVSGTISDPSGKNAVRFWGTLRGKTLRGTFTDRTGESGEWVWDGPLPE